MNASEPRSDASSSSSVGAVEPSSSSSSCLFSFVGFKRSNSSSSSSNSSNNRGSEIPRLATPAVEVEFSAATTQSQATEAMSRSSQESVVTAPASEESPFARLSHYLECSICLSLIVEPVSIPCGHSFCKGCLVKSLRRHKKKCPTCRSVCHIVPEDSAVNQIIKNLSLAIDPDLYALRLAEFEIEKSTWSSLVPIFFYNDALFPGAVLQLHLFEPRYRLMMQRIVNTSRHFAYVAHFSNNSSENIALLAMLKEVDFEADGRCYLTARLDGRFKVVDPYVEEGTHGLYFCRIQKFNDLPLESEEEKSAAAAAVEEANSLLESVSKRPQILAAYGPAPRDLEAFSLWLSNFCLSSESDKMSALSSNDTLMRLRLCIRGLQRLFQSQTTR